MKLNYRLMLILVSLFVIFYFVADYFLGKNVLDKKELDNPTNIVIEKNNYDHEKEIVNNLYNNVRMLYDVVNNKFKVSQDETIVIGDITYKKITNFDETMKGNFTENGIRRYIQDMGNYFARANGEYYLAGNLVSYQTYYFRGDTTNIYITYADDSEIDGIIYVKWTSNNKNTLASIKVINEDNRWLIDDIILLSTE